MMNGKTLNNKENIKEFQEKSIKTQNTVVYGGYCLMNPFLHHMQPLCDFSPLENRCKRVCPPHYPEKYLVTYSDPINKAKA